MSTIAPVALVSLMSALGPMSAVSSVCEPKLGVTLGVNISKSRGLRTWVGSRFQSVEEPDLSLLAAYQFSRKATLAPYWERYKASRGSGQVVHLGAKDSAELAFHLPKIVGTKVTSDAAIRFLFGPHRLPLSRYEARVLALRPGDVVTFDGIKHFKLGPFLGLGQATHVFALDGEFSGYAIRIPLYGEVLIMRDAMSIPEAYVNELPLPTRIAEMRQFLKQTVKHVVDRKRLEVLEQAADGSFAIVRRIKIKFDGREFLRRRLAKLFRPWTWRKPMLWSSDAFSGSEDFLREFLRTRDAEILLKLVLAMEHSHEAIRIDEALKLEAATLKIREDHLSTDPQRVRQLLLEKKISFFVDWESVRQYVYDETLGEWTMVDADAEGLFAEHARERMIIPVDSNDPVTPRSALTR